MIELALVAEGKSPKNHAMSQSALKAIYIYSNYINFSVLQREKLHICPELVSSLSLNISI